MALNSPCIFPGKKKQAFESFFLHASPMWISYAVRWRWGGLGPMPTVGDWGLKMATWVHGNGNWMDQK